jgi:hypothetical protein
LGIGQIIPILRMAEHKGERLAGELDSGFRGIFAWETAARALEGERAASHTRGAAEDPETIWPTRN